MSEFGGKLLELNNAPAMISPPANPPRLDSSGQPWSLDIRNLGPSEVTVTGKQHFTVSVSVGRTVHVAWNGSVYAMR